MTEWKKAWQQCYDYFGLPDSSFDDEIASLRLAYYLASFGMFRASGKIRDLQLKEFFRIVELAKLYRFLRYKEPGKLSDMQDEVECYLSLLRGKPAKIDVSPTDTLVTKIALATTAFVPAYDRFAVLALRHHNIIGTPSLKGLAQIFALRPKDLDRFGAKPKRNRPFMRSLDIGLMETGKSL